MAEVVDGTVVTAVGMGTMVGMEAAAVIGAAFGAVLVHGSLMAIAALDHLMKIRRVQVNNHSFDHIGYFES